MVVIFTSFQMFARRPAQLGLSRMPDLQRAFEFFNNGIPLIKLYKKKPSFEEILSLVLLMSSSEPSLREPLGADWYDNTLIVLKTKNLSATIGLKPNSINCALRQHHLVKVRMLKEEDKIELNDKRDWKIVKDELNEFERSKVESGQQHLLKWSKSASRRVKREMTIEINEQPAETMQKSIISMDFDDFFSIEDHFMDSDANIFNSSLQPDGYSNGLSWLQ